MKDWFDKLLRKYFKNRTDYVTALTESKSVKNLKINGNTISGENITTLDYNPVEITFTKFSENEIEKLDNLINTNPLIKSKISNNVFARELMDCGVKILPTSTDDFEIRCFKHSNAFCSDAVGLLSLLNDLINEDPFIIFQIRGFDLQIEKNYPIPTIEDIISHELKNTGGGELKNLYDINVNFLSDTKNNFDGLAFIYPYLFDPLNSYIEYFNEKHMVYEHLILFRDFNNRSYLTDDFNEIFTKKWGETRSLKLNIDSNYKLSKSGRVRDERSLFAFIMELQQTDYNDCFLSELLELTFKLIRYNAVIPQLFTLSNKYACIRWIPAFYDNGVLSLCRHYFSKCPDDFITYNGKEISKENQVIIAFSLIMQGFIQYYLMDSYTSELKYNLSGPGYELFFERPLKLKTSYRKEIVNEIAKKLSVFDMAELEYSYILQLKEQNNEFYFEIEIDENGRRKKLNEGNLEELHYASIIYDLFDKRGIETQLYEKISIKQKDFLTFNRNIKKLLKYINVEFETPINTFAEDLKLELDLDLEDSSNVRFSDLKNYEWKVICDSERLSLEEFDKLSKIDGLIKMHGKYVMADSVKMDRIKNDILFLPDNIENNELLQIALLEQYRNIKIQTGDNFNRLFDSADIEVPESLGDTLRDYQKIGFSWLMQNINTGFGSILADDMGLGKTLQVLTAILYLKEKNNLENPVLIIAPTTLLSNWENEIDKFTPSLRYATYHGIGREFPEKMPDIILTSYGMIRSDLEKFTDMTWFLCVIDEAQNIKNPSTKQTKAIKQIKAFNKIALTGTPIENRLLDYWSIFDFTNKGYLSSVKKFKRDYVSPIEKRSSDIALSNLKKITKPFILRRLKSDPEILDELPEKNINDIYCNLTKKQAKLYDEAVNTQFSNIKNKKGIDRRGNILKLITILKQICNHPAQYLKTENPKVNESGKIELLVEIIGNIMDVDEKVIIFTQYVEMGEIIEKILLKKFNREVLFLHGSLKREKREDIISKFQNDSHFPILIATLKTGGIGLNLTAAQNVIHYDLWWNPAVENQATDRVYRIGQKKDVMVYRFITKGTLEERIDLMLKEKLELAGKTIGSEETFITEMSDDELMELITLTRLRY